MTRFTRQLRFARTTPLCGLILLLASHAAANDPTDLLKVGKLHPPLALWTIEYDRPVSLASLLGQKVLLVHYASWSEACREPISAWFEQLRPFVTDKKLVVLGIDHEQHADRGRLFAQWKNLPGPLLHDPLDLSGITRLPMFVAIDEAGVVRAIQSNLDAIEKTFVRRAAPKKMSPGVQVEEAALPDPKLTRRRAGDARMAPAYRDHGDALVLSGTAKLLDEALTAYSHAIEMDPKDAWSFFRLGVAYRIRSERPERQPGDFQSAVDAWERAERLMPTCEDFKQRLQQYGPPAGRTAACFDWIPAARTELQRRGVKPVGLEIEPLAVEISLAETKAGSRSHHPPPEKLVVDKNERVRVESTVVPAADRKHANSTEVHLTLRPGGAEWFNRKDPVRIWMEKPASARLDRLYFEIPNPQSEVSDEERTVSFEVETRGKSRGKTTLKGFAVYCLRAGDDHQHKTLRQDFKVTIGGKANSPRARKNNSAVPPAEKKDSGDDDRM